MRTTRTLSLATVVAFSITTAGAAMTQATAESAPAASSAAVSPQSAKAKKIYDRLMKKLPADWQKRQAAAFAKLGIERSPAQRIALAKINRTGKAHLQGKASVIDPEDYQCSPGKLDGYVDSILADIDPSTLFILSLTGALDIPTYDAILFGKANSPRHQLPAEYAPSLKSNFAINKRFWDVPLNDVQLLAMDRTIFSDVNLVAQTVGYLYGVGPADATDIARDILALINGEPALNGGQHPIFTLNAFAFTGEGEPDPAIARLPDKVVFGDGILAAMKAIGNNTVGPKAILAHEVAHHVQYENNTFGTGPATPEGTRRTELMADAFATYAGTHKKGLNTPPAQVLQFHRAFYDVGDCSFDSPGHHGTPNQRMAASAWGAATAGYAANPNRIIPSKSLTNQFDKVLPQILAPDAPGTVAAYRDKIAS